jgi:hypothetical protein
MTARKSRHPRPDTERVFDVVAAYAAKRPVRTIEITALCEAAYPTMEVTNDHIAAMLRRLARRERVLSLSGEDDADRLVELGLPRPLAYEDRHARYWMLPQPAPIPPPIPHQPTEYRSGGVRLTGEDLDDLAREAEQGYDLTRLRPRSRRSPAVSPYPPITYGVFHLALPANDGREEIGVSDDPLDAPDGAVVDVTPLGLGPLRTGWYQRSGDVWIPVAEPTNKEPRS